MGDITAINELTFWWSIWSTLLNIVLLIISVGLAIKSWLDSKNEKKQIKIWMQYSNGLNQGLMRIVQDNGAGRYSTVNDVVNAVWSLQALSFSLYQSLYEERCVSEKEFISEQKKLRLLVDEATKKDLFGKLSSTPVVPPSPMNPPAPVSPPDIASSSSLSPSASASPSASNDDE